MNLEDKLLVWRFNRGDYEAVRRVYEKYKCDLLALAVSLLNNTAAAEDVVHDVFMSFLQLKRFRLTGSLKGYLATCVANAARNVLRADGRHRQEPLRTPNGYFALLYLNLFGRCDASQVSARILDDILVNDINVSIGAFPPPTRSLRHNLRGALAGEYGV